ncbi:MAG: hypothetical protein K0Q73_2740 [Paenibacillus sp.]|nr:hypothetical protein [Paenibacillus sp.]
MHFSDDLNKVAWNVLRRQKKASRSFELSESGARRLKKTSQLLRAGKLMGLQPEEAEKAVSEARVERKSRETSEKNLSTAENRRVSGFWS